MIADVVEPRDLDGLEIEAYDYDCFQPQLAKGAGVYYFGSILHVWPGADCKKILGRLRDAMEKGYSRIPIHEEPLKDRRCHI